MKYIIIILFAFFSISCGSYTMTSYYDDIENVLAITKSGDTIQVPIREFDRRKNYDYYTRFQWNENWYWNNWFNTRYHWDGYYYNRPRYNWYGSVWNTTPSYSIPNRSSSQSTRPTRIRVNTPRGSNNVVPNNRSRTTPNVTRSAPSNSPGRGCAKC